jgi:hypothetical protein
VTIGEACQLRGGVLTAAVGVQDHLIGQLAAHGARTLFGSPDSAVEQTSVM